MSPLVPLRTSALLRQIRQDPLDETIWSCFDARFRPVIFDWCCARLRRRRSGVAPEVDADELTQMILAKLAEKMRAGTDRYDPARGPFRPWLQRVTYNAVYDHLQYLEDQKKRGGVGSGDSEVIELLGSIEAREALEQQLTDTLDRELLEQAMERVRSRVEERTWEAFRRLALEQQNAAGVADALGMKATAVWMARSRVQKLLREEIRKLEASDEA